MKLFELSGLGFGRRVVPILQAETAECGLACIAMVANYHGYRTDIASLRRRFPISLRGAALNFLVEIANRLKLGTRGVRVELQDLRQLSLPCVLHWDFQHFVVLEAVGRDSISIVDPLRGHRRVPMSEVSKSFTGVALELWPNPDFEPRSEKQSVGISDLVGKISGLFRSMGQVLLLALCLELFALLSPLFLQWVIDNVLLTNDRNLLTTLAVGFGLLVVFQQVLTFMRSWGLVYMGTTLNVQWRANVFSHMLRLPGSYFEKRHIGDIVSRFSSIDTIQRTLTTSFVEGVLDGVMSVITLTMLFIYSPLLAWITTGAVALYALARWASYRPLRSATLEQIAHAARQQSHLLETIRGARTIKLFQRYDERRASWLTRLVDQINADVTTQKMQIAIRGLNGLLFGLENIVVICLGAHLVLQGAFSVGMLMAFMAYRGQFSSRVGALIDKIVQLRMLRLHGERLADIVLAEREHAGDIDRLVVSRDESLKASIEIRNLKFRYGEYEPLVLDDVNLKIEEGESVAITGPSGCGKSTLMNIVLGILAPSEGEVLIGGTSVRKLGMDSVRSMIGAVMQEDMLFEGTITDNISFFDSRVDQQWVEKCAQVAHIHEDIADMPMGYNTLIGYMGAALSGGQRQRILLARALYKRPKILLLDEATSNLDVRRELAVSNAIRELNVTRIVIAHRPQTIETTDRVYRLKGGKVVDVAKRGTPGFREGGPLHPQGPRREAPNTGAEAAE